MLCHQAGVTGADIGRIRVFPRHSLVTMSAAAAERVLAHQLHHRGRAVPVRRDRMQGP
jgi:hypothetical protein